VKTLLRRRRRQLLFLCVGGACFLTQYGLLTAMTAGGVYRPLANALGFAASAQLNFALSARLTWRDRSANGQRGTLGGRSPRQARRAFWARLASYNGTALVSLAVNTGVFTIAYHRLGNLAAAALGVVCGMCVTYLVCDLVIFRDRRPKHRAAFHLSGRRRHGIPARPRHDGLAAPHHRHELPGRLVKERQ
jgi:putative flippase GtrA